MVAFDAEDVARLRIAVTRITRVLDRQSRGHTLTGTQASVLATAARLGPLRITELAEIEGINPTMLSRIVGKLEEAGLLHRRRRSGRPARRPRRTDRGRSGAAAPRPRGAHPAAGRTPRRPPERARRRAARRAARPRSARDGAPHRTTPEGPRLTTLSDVSRQAFSSLSNPNYRRYTLARRSRSRAPGCSRSRSRGWCWSSRTRRRRSAPSSPSRPCRRCCSAPTPASSPTGWTSAG